MDLGYRAVLPAVIGRLMGRKRFGRQDEETADTQITKTYYDGEKDSAEQALEKEQEETWEEVQEAEAKEKEWKSK